MAPERRPGPAQMSLVDRPSALARRADVLLMVALAVMANGASLGLARFGYTLVLPPMQAALGASYAAMGAIATANFMGHLIAAPLAGAMAVRWGTRRILVIALALVGGATLGTATAASPLAAAAWQALAGLGTGASVVGAYAMAQRWLPAERQGLATGLVAGGAGWGMFLAGLLVPFVLANDAANWRAGWIALGVPALALAATVAAVGREHPEHAPLVAAGAAASGASSRAQLYRHAALWWLAALYLLWGFAYIIFVTFFGAAAAISNVPAQQVGLAWMAIGAFAGFSGLGWGVLSDRIGRVPALALIFTLQGLASVILGGATTLAWFVAAAVLFGLGGWGVVAVIYAAGCQTVGPRLAPAAIGVLTLAFGIGQVFGPLVAGMLNDATGSVVASSLLAGIVHIAAAVLALAGRGIARIGIS